MKIFNMLTPVCVFFIGLSLNGCTKTVIETRYELKEVPVPVKMDIPNVECYFYGDTESEILNNYLDCIVKQKKVLDTLRKNNK